MYLMWLLPLLATQLALRISAQSGAMENRLDALAMLRRRCGKVGEP
jgi:hypothetical protein